MYSYWHRKVIWQGLAPFRTELSMLDIITVWLEVVQQIDKVLMLTFECLKVWEL